MNESPVLVIAYGRESYVQTDSYWRSAEKLIINGRRGWPKAVGDSSFLVVPGKVRSVSIYVPPATVTTKFTLREDLVCSAKPAWVTPDEHAKLPESDRGLYSPVTEQREQPAKETPFTVVDGKAAPRKMPAGIAPIAPTHVNVHQWFWWTGPCRASREYVFGELSRRVQALDPAQFAVTIYTNIKHLRVDVHAFDLGGKTFTSTAPLVRVDREDHTIPTFDGTDLDDVLAKVNAWCDEKMKPIVAAMSLTACPCCGHALPKGKRPRIVGRDPRHYRIPPKHDVS